MSPTTTRGPRRARCRTPPGQIARPSAAARRRRSAVARGARIRGWATPDCRSAPRHRAGLPGRWCCSGGRRRARPGARAESPAGRCGSRSRTSDSPSSSESPSTTPSFPTQRDAATNETAERIRLGVELGAGRELPVRHRFGRQSCLADERTLDAIARGAAERPRDERGRDHQRERSRDERGQEKTSAERHGRSMSL